MARPQTCCVRRTMVDDAPQTSNIATLDSRLGNLSNISASVQDPAFSCKVVLAFHCVGDQSC